MSVFRPFFGTNSHAFPQNDLTSLLKLLDEPVHRQQSLRRHLLAETKTFAPRFDIKETKTSYELHGELPGIEQKDVQIEWAEGNVLSIHGRTEYSRSEGPSDQSAEKASEKVQEEGWETPEAPEHGSDAGSESHYHKATVEDAAEPGESSTAPAAETEKKEVVKAPAAGEVKKQQKPESKYWVTERSVGEFHRSFSFPALVDQENVKASLKNGILSVTVPKRAKQQVRRIQVE